MRFTPFTASKNNSKYTTREKNVLTTNGAVYIVAFHGIILAQNLNNTFELQSSLVWCCSRTPLIRKSCFLAATAGFNRLQNLPAIYGRLWHIVTSTVVKKKRSENDELQPNFDVVGGTQQKNFFQLFHEVSKIRAILHFDNNNRVARRRVIGQAENNEMELNGKHCTCEHGDWIK